MSQTRRTVLRTPLITLVLLACDQVISLAAQDQDDHRWQELYRDADYQVYLDSADVAPQPDQSYLVWYQTLHSSPRDHEGRPWNREIIRSYLRCDPVSFRTVHITIFHDMGPAIARLGTDPEDVLEQPWKEATASVDRAVLTRACDFIHRRR